MRIRTIKPEFFNHEGIFEAEKEAKLPLRLAFIGLWCAADREGRFRWEPRRLGVQVMPYEGVDFSRVLDALVTRGFVVKYRVNDAWFGCIPSFSRHQVINNRESPSTIPEPPANTAETLGNPRVDDASGTREAREDHASKGEGKGRKGKRKEMEGNGYAQPSDSPEQPAKRFKPPTREELNLEAAKIGLPPNEVDAFVGYYGANGWRVGRNPMRSWQHALSGWAARWRERGPSLHLANGRRAPLPATPDNAGF